MWCTIVVQLISQNEDIKMPKKIYTNYELKKRAMEAGQKLPARWWHLWVKLYPKDTAPGKRSQVRNTIYGRRVDQAITNQLEKLVSQL